MQKPNYFYSLITSCCEERRATRAGQLSETLSQKLADMTDKIYHNTHLCVDVKTQLLNDRIMREGKRYMGIMRMDDEAHFTFREQMGFTPIVRRFPRVYNGRLITITRRDDGSLRLNFKSTRIDHTTDIERYATDVACEIAQALQYLRGKSDMADALFPSVAIGW